MIFNSFTGKTIDDQNNREDLCQLKGDKSFYLPQGSWPDLEVGQSKRNKVNGTTKTYYYAISEKADDTQQQTSENRREYHTTFAHGETRLALYHIYVFTNVQKRKLVLCSCLHRLSSKKSNIKMFACLSLRAVELGREKNRSRNYTFETY